MSVLDASALLALLYAEPGAERVARALPGACMSTVNLTEVLGRFARDGHDPGAVLARLQAHALDLVPFTAGQARIAAELLPATRAAGLSLGDRACLALAIERGLAVLTADRAWAGLGLAVTIERIR